MNQRFTILSSAAALAALVLAGCSGGGGEAPGSSRQTGGDFLVLETEPQNNGRLFLNEAIRLDFSNPVDVNTADLNTVGFTVLDQNGTATSEQPVGTFRVTRSPGDEAVGRRLEFVPAFPTNNSFDNGGFRPGRTYLMQLVGGDQRNGTVLRDLNGKGLSVPQTLRFSTADGTTPTQLFRDVVAGGPARAGFAVSPPLVSGESTLNLIGQADLEVRLTFNQPLNPSSANVPVDLDTDPLLRNQVQKGRIYMEYDDPDPAIGRNRWIPASVELEVNDLDRAVVVLRPVGVLPNNALIRVRVENTLEDISGESNVANAAFDPNFATFRTNSSYDVQFDAVVAEFDDAGSIDFGAPFVEPFAQVSGGMISSSLQFEGLPTVLDYEPTQREVVLNTDFTTIQPKNGQPFNVSGGVFNFNNVTIPAGVSVQGTGSKPMVWLVAQDFTVSGLLSVRGGDGDRVNTLNSANFPAAGGIGQCGGGNGGRGSPNGTARSPEGEAGFGPGQIPAGGGRPGRLACTAGCSIGSGGGGGSFATAGDPWFKTSGYPQVNGLGGSGCGASRSLPGGQPGPLGFSDARTDNNFWGVAVDRNVARQARIVGELEAVRGGAGGGGGGDHSTSCVVQDPNFINDDKGGGGGGGGGAIVVKALGRITVNDTGWINADGGHGGGGEQAGSSDQGGGGGGGSGGMVVLMAGQGITINVKGETYANTSSPGSYFFTVSADGGVTKTGSYRTPVISNKYPSTGSGPTFGTNYDTRPLGGFGGMGVVQLMAPVGDNSDNTNTALDDGITIIKDGNQLTGNEKQRYIAWRGINGRDDMNASVAIGANDGDMRPSPHLMPTPFGSRSRVRSKWVDTGATARRPVLSGDGLPRGVISTPSAPLDGPVYEFGGTDNDGFIAYTSQAGSNLVNLQQEAILASPAVVDAIEPNATFLGKPAYRVTLTSSALGNTNNRYVQYEAELINSVGTVVGEYRILSHTDKSLVLAPDDLLPADAARLQVRAKFFKVAVDGVEGLGQTYRGFSTFPVPIANARIGFAFHQNPSSATASRYPTNPNQFVYDLSDPTVQAVLNDPNAPAYPFVQYDVTFDVSYQSEPGDQPPGLSPNSPTISLDFLRLPFRF